VNEATESRRSSASAIKAISCPPLSELSSEPGPHSPLTGSSYSINLGATLRWQMCAGPNAGVWLTSFAEVIRVQKSTSPCGQTITFVEESRINRFSSVISNLRDEGLLDHLPATGWRRKRLDLVWFAYHPDSADMICEVRWWDNPATNFAFMADAACVLYHGFTAYGAVPVHAALLELHGHGVLLLADGGVGKTTCCLRVPEPWKWLCDDEVLVVPGSDGNLYAHPFPTWSNLVRGAKAPGRSVEQGLPLSAIFFLSQASKDEVLCLGPGAAASRMMSMTLRYFTRPQWKCSHPDDDVALRAQVFANVCSVASKVPSFELKVAREGTFWKEIERVLP